MPQDNTRADIHLKVDQSTKEEWEQFVENSDDLSSLSSLIRRAVSREVSDDFQESEEKYDEVVEELSRMSEDIAKIRNRFSDVQRDILEREDMEEMLENVVERMEEINQERGE